MDIVLEDNKQTSESIWRNIMKGKKGGIQEKIKEFYDVHFTHCYAYKLNLIMRNLASVKFLIKDHFSFSDFVALSLFFLFIIYHNCDNCS